jgi:hypothetical protein
VNTDLDGWLAVASTPVPQYSHHAEMIGSVIILVAIAIIAAVTLLILWGRRGR